MANRNDRVIDRAIEIFGFLMAQELATNSLTPKDTTRMARSFPATVKIIDGPKGKVVRFTPPKYTDYVNDGTKYIKARHFIQRIFHQKAGPIVKKSFRIANSQIK